jgi:hypothetical protein
MVIDENKAESRKPKAALSRESLCRPRFPVSAFGVLPLLAADVDPERVRLLRAQGSLALTILVIVMVGLIALLRIYTRSIRRRWRTPVSGSRMHPLQWQARRWREEFRKRSTPTSNSDSEN